MNSRQFSIKIPKLFFTKLEKNNVIFYGNTEESPILRKKNKARAIMLYGFKLYHKATVIKTG